MRFFALITALFFIAGCSSGNNNHENKIVAQINKYKMTEEDLRYEFRNAPYDEIELLKTEEGRKRYLAGVIEKEALLQEAQRRGLDREKEFMKSIENYWEQALLKMLFERRIKEISGNIYISNNEIDEYYRGSGEDAPLSKVKNNIRDAIKQKKESEAMNAWIEELKNKAYININEKALEKAFSNNN